MGIKKRFGASFNTLSKQTFALLFVVVLVITFVNHNWTNPKNDGNKIIVHDKVSYYAYLPAIFIHHDLQLKFTDTTDYYQHSSRFWPSKAPNGGNVIKTAMGMSVLYAPFFLMGHANALISPKHPADGFSQPYEMFIAFSCIFYYLLGLYFLRKLLIQYFSELITSLVLVVLALGTNLYYYTNNELALPHPYAFTLTVVFLYVFLKWRQNPKVPSSILLGALFGLIVLVRPTNGLIMLVPLLYGVFSFKDLQQQVMSYVSRWRYVLIAVFVALFLVFMQLWYWHYITGNWLFNSYIGETFYFNNPHILEGLFSYRKGWFVYTPIMILSIFGIYHLYRSRSPYFWPVLIFVPINIYIIFSWWCWWYGGGFGARPMIDSYGLLAIPMAAFFQVLVDRKKWVKGSATVVIGLFMCLNIFQSLQKRNNVIHWDSMTKSAYWDVFMVLEIDDDARRKRFEKTLSAPDYDKAKKGIDEYEFGAF